MRHVDEFLDDPKSDPIAREFLEAYRKPASEKNWVWIIQNPLFCTFEGKRYRCTGASRLGDVWLSADFNRLNGYELRVDVDACSEWSKSPMSQIAESLKEIRDDLAKLE